MRLASVSRAGQAGVAIASSVGIVMLAAPEVDLDEAIWTGRLASLFDRIAAEGQRVESDDIVFRPLLAHPRKIICLGLNFADHAAEGGAAKTELPVIVARFASSLIGHRQPMIRPRVSDQLDFEGELAVIIGLGGRHIAAERGLDHVAGYTVFNDASIRDWQNKTSQWTAGKNFDGTGALGPWLVTADELPAGASRLGIETRLNGQAVQTSSTANLIFPVAETIALLSKMTTLEPGDVIAMGTPAGVGFLRKPPLFMKPGDLVEVEIEQVGLLQNEVVAE